ncbi:hypothetical protein CVT24_005776 [Panaeolus cyanescens]|uniref:Uncharacterized protein n=1 Tax=Panaeolus cyanescens TaxID=181874 RepID=A0A409V926_9AGAR|nr:hypothetical protein CVT24_005776 [Panaeolus cyanescens]
MIPSSSSNLSSKTNVSRPSSSLASRPASRATNRPSSRNSNSHGPRPQSSLTSRPVSVASTRPQSRFSQRPSSRHARSRLIPSCQTLVNLITGLTEEENEEKFREAVEYAVRSLEMTTINKAAASVDLTAVERQIGGLALKARINSQDNLSDALQASYRQLSKHLKDREDDLDHEIQDSRIPDHLQFLLALSKPPSETTLVLAGEYLYRLANPTPKQPPLTWADILADDPFEGEHWEGIYGLSTGSNRHGVDGGESWDTSPSLSPLNSDDLALDDEDSSSSSGYNSPISPDAPGPVPPLSPPSPPSISLPDTCEHRDRFKELETKQYWKDNWQGDASLSASFDIGNPSTLGPALSLVLAKASEIEDAQQMLGPEKYIDEDDMVREVIMALQGNKNIVFTLIVESECTEITALYDGFSAVLTLIICKDANTLSSTSDAFRGFGQRKRTTVPRTCEAFADAIDHTIRGFDAWCAAKEEAICAAYNGRNEEPIVISLMNMEKEVRSQYQSTFTVLLEVIQKTFLVKPESDFASFDFLKQRRPPAVLTTVLLDTLFASIQGHMERQDTETSEALMSVFVRTSEPVWSMIGNWLMDGMAIHLGIGNGGSADGDELDEEFFIESSGVGVGAMALGLLDPEFWKEGYAIREWVQPIQHVDGDADDDRFEETRQPIPAFLQPVASMVLSAGKALGLVRALGEHPSSVAFRYWKCFEELIRSELGQRDGVAQGSGLFSVSIDTLSRLIYDYLLPGCQITGAHLVTVLVKDCSLWHHLNAIENVFFMRKGDSMSHFIDIIFNKMDTQQPWNDFHFLNAAFSDVIQANQLQNVHPWINTMIVRFSYKNGKDKGRTIKRTVKAIEGLAIEYDVPFPLGYIFTPGTLQVYNNIFTFLLQIRRAKSVLERILIRGERGRGTQLREELKVFYAMRSRLSWFINTLLNFLSIHVIDAETAKFHEIFRSAKSLDEMIQLHDEHLDKVLGRCLLKHNTSALHRAIIAILDMSLHFSEGFVDFAGDTTATLDVSRQSLIMKGHRSRHQRRMKRNIVGFSAVAPNEDESSEEEDDYEFSVDIQPPEPSYSQSLSGPSGREFPAHVEKMSSELDGLVKFLRRGTESLASGLKHFNNVEQDSQNPVSKSIFCATSADESMFTDLDDGEAGLRKGTRLFSRNYVLKTDYILVGLPKGMQTLHQRKERVDGNEDGETTRRCAILLDRAGPSVYNTVYSQRLSPPEALIPPQQVSVSFPSQGPPSTASYNFAAQVPLHIQTSSLSISDSNSLSSQDDSLSISAPLPFISQRIEPSHLRINHFGSRFLPHTTSQIRCVLPLLSDRLILVGHDDGLSVLDMFPQEWSDEGEINMKGPNEAYCRQIWKGECVYQMSILEVEDQGVGTPQGVVLAVVGPSSDSGISHRDPESIKNARMYNLGSLISLARWTIAQKVAFLSKIRPEVLNVTQGSRPLELHKMSTWQTPNSPSKKHRAQGSIARSIKSLIDNPHPQGLQEQSSSYQSFLSPVSSGGSNLSRLPMSPDIGNPQRQNSDEAGWDVVDDLPVRWATDFVPLATPGSRLVGASVICCATWNDEGRKGKGTGGQLLAIATKNNIFLYETPKGERAYRFVKEFYTPLQPRNMVFIQQAVPEMNRGPMEGSGRHHSHKRSDSGGTLRGLVSGASSSTPLKYGTHLSLFVVFDKKAGLIRLADSAVGEMELGEDGGPQPPGLLYARDTFSSTISTTSLRQRARLSFDIRESASKWLAPLRCELPTPGYPEVTQPVYVITKGKRTHIVPCPLPVRSSAVPPLHAVFWKSHPKTVSARVIYSDVDDSPLLQLISLGENGLEVQETGISFINSKGKGRAFPDEIVRAEEDLGGEAGFLATGGNWDRVDQIYGPQSLPSAISALSVDSTDSEAIFSHLKHEEGIYGWCRKGAEDYRVFWVGGGRSHPIEEVRDDESDIYY